MTTTASQSGQFIELTKGTEIHTPAPDGSGFERVKNSDVSEGMRVSFKRDGAPVTIDGTDDWVVRGVQRKPGKATIVDVVPYVHDGTEPAPGGTKPAPAETVPAKAETPAPSPSERFTEASQPKAADPAPSAPEQASAAPVTDPALTNEALRSFYDHTQPELERLRTAHRELMEAKSKVEAAKGVEKEKRETYEQAVQSLLDAEREAAKPNLFTQPKDASPDDSWRLIPLDQVEGFPKVAAEKIASTQKVSGEPVTTLGLFIDWQNQDNSVTQIPGIGQATAEKIADAIVQVCKKHPGISGVKTVTAPVSAPATSAAPSESDDGEGSGGVENDGSNG